MTAKTYDLAGFIASLRILIDHAERGKLVAASINLDPTGFGHYSFRLVDGDATPGDSELDRDPTAPTAPGKGQKKR